MTMEQAEALAALLGNLAQKIRKQMAPDAGTVSAVATLVESFQRDLGGGHAG